MAIIFSDSFDGSGDLGDHVSDSGHQWGLIGDVSGVLGGGVATASYSVHSGASHAYLGGNVMILPDTTNVTVNAKIDFDSFNQAETTTVVDVSVSRPGEEAPDFLIRFFANDVGVNGVKASNGGTYYTLPGGLLGIGVHTITLTVDSAAETIGLRIGVGDYEEDYGDFEWPITSPAPLEGMIVSVFAQTYSMPAVAEYDAYLPKLASLTISTNSDIPVFWTNIIRSTETP